jgi:hypothetical protein
MTGKVHTAVQLVHERISGMNTAYVRSVAALEEALETVKAAMDAPDSDAALAQHAISYAIALGDGGSDFLRAWRAGDTSRWPEFQPFFASPALAPVGDDRDTPASEWHATGKADPHAERYNCPRSALIGGEMTDDEVANAIYMDGSEKSLTIAKDRIRWLSRQLLAAQQDIQTSTPAEKSDFRNEIIGLIDSPTVLALAKVFSPENVANSRTFSEQIADVFLGRKAGLASNVDQTKIRNEIADVMRGDDEADTIHREAAAMWLFWPSNAIDLARSPETYPRFSTELAKLIANWENRGRLASIVRE